MLPVFIAFGFYNRWWRYVSTQDMWGVLRGVAVAVVAAFLVFAILDFHPRVGSARDLGHRPAPPARLRHGRAPARADDHRATVHGLARGARQGGAHRRRRRRGAADPPRDAAQPVARLHANRARRRRPAQEEPPAPRHPRPRHDGRAPRAPARAAPGRAPHRDSVGLGRRARADRRDGARGSRAGEHAPGPARAHRRRLRPRPADPTGRGGGSSRPRARRGGSPVDRGLSRRARSCS